ncbi:histidinol-phosphate transaminase [Leucobacter sp.]
MTPHTQHATDAPRVARAFRPGLEQIAAYRAGKPAPVGPDGRSVKLSSNENPYPPLPAVERRLAEILPTSIARYPSIAAAEVTGALADRFGVSPDNLVLGAGSVEVAAQLIHALTAPGDEVMYAWRSFEAYPILTRVAGAVPVEVPLDPTARHDLPAMAAAITDRTRLVFVCNPNNPTGTVVGEAELEAFMAAVPEHVLVVIDEAYVHFDRDPGSPSGIDFFRRYPNVAVLHTFSKAYGLAGLRIGYAIASRDVAEALRKVAIPFAVSRLAQEAALASLEAEAELEARIEEMIRERARLVEGLSAAGIDFAPSQANFVWLTAGAKSEEIAEAFEARGISVRCFAGEGVRVSIGTPEENDAVLAAISDLG